MGGFDRVLAFDYVGRGGAGGLRQTTELPPQPTADHQSGDQ
jgi:hypothetical protein